MQISRHFSHASFYHRGFSLLEIIIVLSIMGILAAIVMVGFKNFVQHAALKAATHDLYTTLSDARSATLAAEGGEQYGVRIEPTRIIRFRGATYNPSNSGNYTVDLRGISATAVLDDGGSDILFEKQTGSASGNGTITLTQEATLASTMTRVYTSGLVSQ